MKEQKFKINFKHEWNNFSLFCWYLNEKTLEGFTEEAKIEFNDLFKNAKNNRERVELILNNSNITDYLEHKASYFLTKINHGSQKNMNFCIQCKKTGDNYFKKKNYVKSLKYYSIAILFYDHNYFKSNNDMFNLTLSDLFLLRGRTFDELGQYPNSNKDYLEALKLNKNCLDVNSKEKVMLSLSKENNIDLKDNFFNPNLEGATSGISMSYSEQKGRLIIANRDIEEGEILFKEEPYVHWLRPSFYDSYCNHCLSKLTKHQFVPCDICINVLYCSSKCKEIAFNRYHKIECKYLNFLTDLSSAHMALRLMLRDGLDYVFEEDNKEPIPLKDWPKIGFKADYSCIKSLIGEENFTNSENYCSLVIGCIMIAILFVKTKLIEEKNVKQFASILLKSLMQILENTFMIYGYEFKSVNEKSYFNLNNQNLYQISSIPAKVGVGLYSTASLIPHSCDNNSYKYYFNSLILIVADKKITSNTEVNIEYGVHYKINSLKDRKSYLMNNFVFDCKCAACELEYENVGLAMKCVNCKKGALICNLDLTNYCLNCKIQNVNLSEVKLIINKSETHFNDGIEFYNQNNMKQAEFELRTCEKLLSKIYFNDLKLLLIKSQLNIFYYSNNKFDLAYQYLIKTLPLNKNLYGENSFESLCCLIELAYLAFENYKYLSKNNVKITFKMNPNKFFFKLFNTLKSTKERVFQPKGKKELNVFATSSNEHRNKYSLHEWQELLILHFKQCMHLISNLSKRKINIVNEDTIICLNKLNYLKNELNQ